MDSQEETFAIQTSKWVKSSEDEKRHNVMKKAGIIPAVITPENMMAVKFDIGIPWEKLKCMSR